MTNPFKDKTVAIVGNADIDVDKKDARGHDIVVVMNSNKHNIPFDYYCYSGEEFLPVAERLVPAKCVYHMSPKDRDKADGGVKFYDMDHWHILYNLLLGSRPTTGMMVVDMVRRAGAKKITLFGFDFFETGTCSAVHCPSSEKRLLQAWGIV